MSKISRYIVKEHIGPFTFSLAVIMFVFVIKFILQYIGKIFGKGLPFLTIFEFIYLNLAWMLALAVPMSVLIASLMAFGRLSADNEITILKSSGINLYRIIRPALAAAAVLTLAMIWYNDQVLPDFNHRARKLFKSITEKKPTFSLEEGLYFQKASYQILVENIERREEDEGLPSDNILEPNFEHGNADRLRHITIFHANSQQQQQRTIIADHGYLVFDKGRAQLIFHLFDGEIHEVNNRDFSEYRTIDFDRTVFNIPAGDLIWQDSVNVQRGDREMDIAMMQAKVTEFRQSITDEYERSKTALENFIPKPEDVHSWMETTPVTNFNVTKAERRISVSKASRKAQSTFQTLQSSVNSRNYFGKQISRYEVEIQKKYSIPVACIVFVLIGAPLGIRSRKGSIGMGVGMSVGFFLLYWVCLIGGEDLADKQIVDPRLAMWFPNILVGSLGMYLTYKTVKETAFFDWSAISNFFRFSKRHKEGEES